MPSYRCPYCKHDLGATALPRCPSCGRVMGLPGPLRPATPPAHRETRERLHRAAEQQRKALGLRDVPSRAQHPFKPLIIIVIMSMIGGFVLLGTWRAPRVNMQANKSHRAEFELNALRAAVEVFRRECGRYPTTREGQIGRAHV